MKLWICLWVVGDEVVLDDIPMKWQQFFLSKRTAMIVEVRHVDFCSVNADE